MLRLAVSVCAVAFLLVPSSSQNDLFSKYERIEAFELKPGILIIPSYTANGQVCMAVVEKHHYVNGVADLDSTLPPEIVTQIFDELAPPSERGPLTTDPELARLSFYAGGAAASLADYKNVSLTSVRSASSPGDIFAVIQWKGRSCQ